MKNDKESQASAIMNRGGPPLYFSRIVSTRLENEPSDSKVIMTCDIRLLLLEIQELRSQLEKSELNKE